MIKSLLEIVCTLFPLKRTNVSLLDQKVMFRDQKIDNNNPLNSCLSVRACMLASVWNQCSIAWNPLISFFILAQRYLVRIKRTGKNRILWKILLCPKTGKMGQKWPIRLKDSLKCNISRKPGIRLIFCMYINIKVLNK